MSDLMSLTPDALRSLAASTFTGSYQTLGAALTRPIRLVKIVNNTNQDCTISWDGGTTDHDIIPAFSFVLYDGQTNALSGKFCQIKSGTQFEVKASVGTGTIYLVALGVT